MQDFATRELVINHVVDKSKRCAFYYDYCADELPAVVLGPLKVIDLDGNSKLKRKAWRPNKQMSSVCRVCGPLHHVAHAVGVSHKIRLKGRFKLPEQFPQHLAQFRCDPYTQCTASAVPDGGAVHHFDV